VARVTNQGALRTSIIVRRPAVGQTSVERVFRDVCNALPGDVEARLRTLPHSSRGIAGRVGNLIWALQNRSGVHHVGGDVHYVVLGLPRRRTVLTILDLAPLQRQSGVRRWLLTLLWYRLPVWWAAEVTVISEATRDALVAALPWAAPKLSVVHCPVGPEFSAVPPRPPDGVQVILQVGTGWNKNFERVAVAVSRVSGELSQLVRFRVVGALSDDQRALLGELGIQYISETGLSDSEVRAAYAESDVVTFVSVYEGFGLPIVEAQAIGRPVVTSDCASMPEVAGAGAIVVDPLDPFAIQGALYSVLSDPAVAGDVVKRGFENVQRFEASHMSLQYAAIYRRLAKS
jgi:glycosyltransferase involved in cell wall biosynthesis